MASPWRLDPDVVFLNHGSFGACPEPVLAAQQAVRDELEREPVRFFVHRLMPLLDGARAELAAFLGAAPDDLVFVPNATTGVNAVLRSLALAPGDELLTTDHAYGACRNALEFVAERAGARVVVARVPFPLADAGEVVAAVAAAVTPRTRLALIDHVTSPTGLVFPLARIIAALRERGVGVLVDGAHAPGMVPLALDELGADYYTGNLHKWVCAPKGAAFLWVRRELQPTVRPAVISHGVRSPWRGRSRFHLEFDWTGTDDPSAWLAVPEALRFLAQLGGAQHMRRNRELALAARDLLVDALGIAAPAPDDMIGALAAVPLPDGDARVGPIDALQHELMERHRIEVPVIPWPAPPKRMLRISAQAYNTLDQYRNLAGHLGD